MSHIFVVVCTQFLPGEWIDRPEDHLLPEGCLELLKIVEEFYQGPVKPVQPRYIFNFDDWGRHLFAAVSPNHKGSQYYAINAEGTEKSNRGRTSMSRRPEQCDAKTGEANNKIQILHKRRRDNGSNGITFRYCLRTRITKGICCRCKNIWTLSGCSNGCMLYKSRLCIL